MLFAAITNAVPARPIVPQPNEWPFNWFDVVVVVMAIIGIFRGRKHGMSEELLMVLKWLLIVVVGGWAYRPLGTMLVSYAPYFSLLAAFIIIYVLIALIIQMLISKLKTAMGEKLVGSDLFGRSEYYLGMIAGAVRWLCMAIFFMALMNARLITAEERARTEKMQKLNFEDIRFPTFGEVQQDVLFRSLVGKFATTHLSLVLIQSTAAEQASPQSKSVGPAFKRKSVVDDVLDSTGPPKR